MRKLKKLAFQAGSLSGDRKMKGKVAGIPAKEKPIDLGKHKDSVQEKNDLQVDDDEFQDRNEVVQGLKQQDFDLEIPVVSGESMNEEDGEEKVDSDGLGYEEEDADEESEEELDTTGTENQGEELEEDEDDSDDDLAGEMGSDDSGGDTNGSELENTHHGEGKLTKPTTCKNTTGKTSNEMPKHVAGENIIGNYRRKISDSGMTKTELEKIHRKGVIVSKPGHQGNNNGKSSNDVVKVVAGENTTGEMGSDEYDDDTNGSELENNLLEKAKLIRALASKTNAGKTLNELTETVAGGNTAGKSRRHTSGDETEDRELESIPCSKTKLTLSSKCKNSTGKTSNEQLEVVAGENTIGKSSRKIFDGGLSKTELEKIHRKDVMVSKPKHQGNDNGKATNEHSKSRAAKSDKNLPCAGAAGGGAGLVGAGGWKAGAGTGDVGASAGTAWATNGPGKTFAQLFKSKNANGNGFQLQLTGEENSNEDLKIEDDDVEDTSEAWGYSLIGYIAGKNPSYNAVIGFCKSWTKKCRVHFNSSGWIVVKFDEKEDLKRILEGGPYLIYGKPFIVKAMPKYFCYDKSEICKAQVWVNLPHLPLELWTEKALSKIGSRIGHPILVDSITASKERVSFARILVEVDLAKVLREDIALILPNGRRIVQEVRYEYLPSYCEDCHAIGHDGKACARRKDQVEGRKLKMAELVPTVVEHRKPNIGAPSDLVSQKNSNLHTSDASTASMGDSEEGSEDEFVEYVSKNRKKALAKAKRPIGQASQGSRPSGQMVGVTRPIEHRAGGAKLASEGVLSRVRDSSRGDDRGNMKTVGSGLGKPGLTKEGGTSIAPRRGSHANLL